MHQNHQMYMNANSNTANFSHHHIQTTEPNHIDNSSNCQQLIIIQPQYAQYDYAPTPNDYTQSAHLGSQINTSDFNSTLPIMDVDSFVANLSNLEEVQYCIDSHQQQNHLHLPTQLQSLDNLHQHQSNNQAHNKLNYEDYSLSHLEATTHNYAINMLEPNNNNNNSDSLDSKINEKLSKVDILNQVILNASNTQSSSSISSNKSSINDFSSDHISNHYYNNHNSHTTNVIKSKKSFDSKLKFKQKGREN